MARQRSLTLFTSEVYQPRSFDRMDDAHQIETLTKNFPYRWRNGQRDSVESLATVLAYAREEELFRKCDCTTWEEFCRRYYDGEAAGFDELIDGVRILQSENWRGPITERHARDRAQQAHQARQEKADYPQGRPRKGEKRKLTNLGRGGSSAYRLRRLARLKGDVLERYERGEFASVEAAYRHAFALEDLRRAWKRASEADRAEFLAEINNFWHEVE
jgi:hypothetical protein